MEEQREQSTLGRKAESHHQWQGQLFSIPPIPQPHVTVSCPILLSKFMDSTYNVPGTLLHTSLIYPLKSLCYHYPHCTDEETEVQRTRVPCPRLLMLSSGGFSMGQRLPLGASSSLRASASQHVFPGGQEPG